MSIERRKNLPAPPDDVLELIRASGDVVNRDRSYAAQAEMAEAVTIPIRKTILDGDVTGGIFAASPLPFGAAPEYPMDIVAPNSKKEYRAYAIPAYGRIPERTFESDYVTLPVYEIGNSMDWPLRLLAAGRYDIHARAMEIYEAGFVKKINDDAFAVLLMAAAERNVVVYDANAGQGRFTHKLLSLMDRAIRRNGGGNTASLNPYRLTDVYASIEALEDMRNFTVADVPESVRERIFNSRQGFLAEIFGIRLHDMTEFGVGQEYQNLYADASGINGQMASGDVEIVLGLDLQDNSTFVNPIRTPLETFVDDNLHRQRRGGVYGWLEHALGVLDNLKVIVGSL